jgi:hypothetical protein
MAFPALAAIPALLAKLGVAAKATGAAVGTKAALGAKAAAVGAGAAKGAGIRGALGTGTRMAGQALGGLWKHSGATNVERVMRLGPDMVFGGMAAVNTPGDFGDKLIAGGTQAIGSIGLGLGASKLPGIRGTQLEGMADMTGSIAGDFGGMYLGDALLRAKGGGTTPWEKMQMEGNEQMRRELEQQIMAQYGVAGYRPHQLFNNDGMNGMSA